MDHYDQAELTLNAVEGRISADPQLALLSALARAMLSLADRVETLTYLMYGEGE